MGKGSRGSKGTIDVTMDTLGAGVQKAYLEGLDNLRKIITDIECNVDKVKREFYQCEENNDDLYEQYLKDLNEKLLYCNTKLRKHDVKLQPIDGELSLVAMLNKIRELPPEENVNQETLDLLTEYWEHMKITMDGLTAIKDKFKHSALKRLKHICSSYNNGEAVCNINLTRQYGKDVRLYRGEIRDLMEKFERVNKSFTNGVQQNLFTDSSFANRILMSCDQKAFPILRVVPDLTEKLIKACNISKLWIDKDETYIHDISNYIREKRSQTRRKEQDLRQQKEKKGEMEKTVTEAHAVFKMSKEKLAQIEAELQILEEQMSTYSRTRKYKTEEKRQKEGIVGFLEVSISQTKKNYTLQLKRSRLMRQLRELEESLKEIEKELTIIEQNVEEKAKAKTEIASVVEEKQMSYSTVKSDLDKFSQNVEKLQKEVNQLTDSLTSLEIIQSVKTSPETVEDFYERPVSVKLAPSLKEKIQRKRKLKMKSSGHRR